MKNQSLILKILIVLTLIIFFSTLLVALGFGLGMIASNIPGVPKVKLIADKILVNRNSGEDSVEDILAFPGCGNEFDSIINVLRNHTSDPLSEVMVNHLEQSDGTFLNWYMQTIDGTPFYARYETDGIYNMSVSSTKIEDLEQKTIAPLVTDLKSQGFEFPSLSNTPSFENENGEYVRRLGFTKKFKSSFSDEIVEGKYVLEAQEIANSKVNITLNCKEDADQQYHEAYNKIYDWYAKSNNKIEKDTVVGIDESYLSNLENPEESKLFVFEIGTPSNAWMDAPKEVWIKDGEDKIKMIEKINTKPDCAILAKNAINDVVCVNPLTGKLQM